MYLHTLHFVTDKDFQQANESLAKHDLAMQVGCRPGTEIRGLIAGHFTTPYRFTDTELQVIKDETHPTQAHFNYWFEILDMTPQRSNHANSKNA